MTVDLKKIILTAVAFSTAAVSCTEKVQVEPVPAGRGIEFALAYEDYHDGEGLATDGSSGNAARTAGLFTFADYDRVEFAVMDGDGTRYRDMMGLYDKSSSSIRVEGLVEGSYSLLVLGIRGDDASDGAAIEDINSLSDIWLSFPEDISRPLSAEYFYSLTPFDVIRKQSAGGYVLSADIEGPVIQKRIVGRVDFDFSFSRPEIEAAVESNTVTLRKPGFSTAVSADGKFHGRTTAEKWTLDMAEGRTFYLLPASGEDAVEGTAEILSGSYSGDKVRRFYDFGLGGVSSNVMQTVRIKAAHPDDESGTLYVTEKFYEAGNHAGILQDDEPYEVYTDKSLRRFNTSAPLQVSVTEDGRLNVRFYSPREVRDVLVRAKIPAEGDFFVDLAYFDRIPAFADFYGNIALTERSAFYRTDSGRIAEIGRKSTADLAGMEFRIESGDPYWGKLEKIEHGWNVGFDLYGGDPTLPDGGPKGNWMGIRPVHCREAVAFFLNFTYMIDMPEHERILRENQDRLYGNGGVDDKVAVETVLEQMRQPRTVNVGLVYTGNGVLGLGGGSVFGAYQGGWLEHYTSRYACEIMFHELGHVMGYSHNSSFTYGPWAQELMNSFYVTHLSEMPIDSPGYTDSAGNPNLY